MPAADGSQDHVRHYSLCNSSAETHRYVIAVGRVDNSRGGSVAMHERVRVGSRVGVKTPRNNFPLVRDAQRYRFVAAGIGITPILSMIRWCESNQKDWTLLYYARSRLRASFYETLRAYVPRVRFHFDDEASGAYPDLRQELGGMCEGEHVYCCGPQPLMHAVQTACEKRPTGSVHFEWFSPANETIGDVALANQAFEVVLRSTGRRLTVTPDRTILETLEQGGVSMPFACREGLCGSCETGLCDGEADHRDYVLSEIDRRARKSLMICVSRALSDVLVLDI
ncbi:PDR/VanB family oxidoreductase [Paraburkholderia fungorum]|uniref:PDR/VanB family oxidoreductase n=1 Tax=Paraburkholderia fungorum TaxID=134537 RepID=UPI0038BCF4F1